MTTELSREDRVILEVVDRLSRDRALREDADLVREITELAGLLSYELAPETPRAEVWESIRTRLGTEKQNAGKRDTGKRDVGVTVVPFPQRSTATAAVPVPPPALARRPAHRGLFAMAAVLALCLLGLGYFWGTVRNQQSTIARLTSELDAAAARPAELALARNQLDMITRVARQYYPMRPAAAVAQRQQPASGKVFVCGRHEQWYLNVQGLEPPPTGYEYCLWYVTGEGMVMGGAVTLREGAAELSAATMPEDTRGFAVTLEKKSRRHDEPQGEILLLGEEPVSM